MFMIELIPKGHNLVTYYLLPLMDVNKVTFGRSFNTSYVNVKGTKVFVEMHHSMITPNYRLSPHYSTEIEVDGVIFVIFVVPLMWLKDVQLFIEGKYSHISKEAKKIIYKTSSLPYNVRIESFPQCHPILQALGRTKKLREYLTEVLHIQELPDTAELMRSPDPEWFIEHRISQLTEKI